MKKLVLILGIFFLPCLPSWAAEISAISQVTKVTVYTDRALVTRTAEVELEKGSHSVVFEGLPAGLLEESLRVEGKGSMAVTLQGAELKKIFTTEQVDEHQRKLREELEKLQDERRLLDAKGEALQFQKSFLNSISNFGNAQVPKDIMTHMPNAGEWSGVSQFLLDAHTQNATGIASLEFEIRQKDREIEAKQRELGEIGAGASEMKTVLVNLEAAEKGKFKMELSYLVWGASWVLSYDAKVMAAKKTCTLVTYGDVRNGTGEDWTQVSLTLSSSKPAIGGKMPELTPWYVDFFQAFPQAKVLRAASLARMEEKVSGAMQDVALKEQEFAAAIPQAQVAQDLGSVTFELGRPVTVAGDNHLYHLPVLSEDFAISLDYEATPKLSPYAFLHSQVLNDKDHPLAAGPVNIFFNGNYVGKSFLNTVGKGEKFDLYLGVDEEIKIKRTALVDLSKKTLLGLKARRDYGYSIEMENYKKEPVTLKIIDQIPTSRNNDIKAQFVSSSVKPETKDLGRLEWKFNLEPSEKEKLEFQFFVEYPSDKSVAGI